NINGALSLVHDHRRHSRRGGRAARMVTAGVVHRYRVSKLSSGCECIIDVNLGIVCLEAGRELGTREIVNADKRPAGVSRLGLEYDFPGCVQSRGWWIEGERVGIGERDFDCDVRHLTILHKELLATAD